MRRIYIHFFDWATADGGNICLNAVRAWTLIAVNTALAGIPLAVTAVSVTGLCKLIGIN